MPYPDNLSIRSACESKKRMFIPRAQGRNSNQFIRRKLSVLDDNDDARGTSRNIRGKTEAIATDVVI